MSDRWHRRDHHYDEALRYGPRRPGTGERFLAYLRTRSTEHWIFFAVGIVIGALIG